MDCSICKTRFSLLNGLCEKCYRQQNILPILKQREVSQSLVDEYTRLIQFHSNELNRARQAVDNRTTNSDIAEKLRERQKLVQRGDIRALGYLYCNRCHAPFELGTELILHESECNVLPKRASVPRTPKLRVTRSPDDLGDM